MHAPNNCEKNTNTNKKKRKKQMGKEGKAAFLHQQAKVKR
jgi:hypothetical protein